MAPEADGNSKDEEYKEKLSHGLSMVVSAAVRGDLLGGVVHTLGSPMNHLDCPFKIFHDSQV